MPVVLIGSKSKMSIKHFKKLYDIAKEKGVESALGYDFLETLGRHPALAGAYITSIMSCPAKSQSEPEPKVYFDKTENCQPKEIKKDSVPIARNNGLISDAVFKQYKDTIPSENAFIIRPQDKTYFNLESLKDPEQRPINLPLQNRLKKINNYNIPINIIKN